MPISSPFRSKERTEEQRCGQSADVKKYSIYFGGITIPISSSKIVSYNNYKCQHCLKYKWGIERSYFGKSNSAVVSAVMGQFLYYKGSSTHSRRWTTYVSGYYFSVYLSSNLYLLHEQKTQKSKEHYGFMDHEGNEKDSDKEKNQNSRFLDK